MPENQMNYFSTSINVERPDLQEVGLYCACATCKQMLSVSLALRKDGTILYNSTKSFLQPSNPHSKLVAAQTGGGNLSISCGHCRSGITKIQILRGPDGISSSPEKSKICDCIQCDYYGLEVCPNKESK